MYVTCTWLSCFLFGAILCLGIQDHSSKSQHQESIAEAQKAVLEMFGLKTLPKRVPNDQVPQFMLDLYHRQVNDQGHTEKNEKKTLDGTIRAFRSEGNNLPGQVPTLPENTWNLFFKVSSFPSQEILSAAELRLPFSVVKSAASESVQDEPCRIKVYQIQKPARGKLHASIRLIDTKTAAAEGTLIFDLSSVVRHWLRHPKENFGLQVQLVTSEDSPIFEVNNDETAEVDKRPFLVTYSRDSQPVDRHTNRPNEGEVSTRSTPSRACEKHDWVIDFDELYGDNNFVISPTSLPANYCKGECRFPLSDHMNATNHAVFQVLAGLTNSDIPPPCCAPTRLSNSTFLITNENGVPVMKRYSNVVVQECGCL